MAKCEFNEMGMHSFAHTQSRVDEDTLGENGEFHVDRWLTCISCGERRAISSWGELLVKENGNWKVLESDHGNS